MIRLLKAVGLLALLALCLSSGAFGFFTYQATSLDNGLTAGTLYIGKDDNNKGILDGSLKLSKMIPGEAPREFKLNVKNVGNLKAYLNGLSASVKESDNMFMANAVQVTCSGPGGKKLYAGSLLSLVDNPVPVENEVALEPGEAVLLTFTFQLDHRAGNWYKGKNIEVSLTVHAGQNPGQELETNVVVAGANIQEAVDRAKPKSVVLVPAGEYGRLQINRSDIAIKAKDVVFDTVLRGIVFSSQAQDVGVQGFTVDGRGDQDNILLIPNSAKNVSIKDNIFHNARKDGGDFSRDVKLGRSAGLTVQRNDFSALISAPARDGRPKDGKSRQVNISSGNSQLIRYNLGLDLDPAEEAL